MKKTENTVVRQLFMVFHKLQRNVENKIQWRKNGELGRPPALSGLQ